MPNTRMRILVVGKRSPPTNVTLGRLARRGYGFRAVETLRDGEDLMKTFAFDMVLAAESLPGGRGYDLMRMVVRRGITLLVAVALSESCVWLPVVEFGQKVLGTRAINADALEVEVEKLLKAGDQIGARALRVIPPKDGPGLEVVSVPRRKDILLV
jgi:DNA-binding response OmpR family regulator